MEKRGTILIILAEGYCILMYLILQIKNLQCLLYRNVGGNDVLFQKYFTELDYLDCFSR